MNAIWSISPQCILLFAISLSGCGARVTDSSSSAGGTSTTGNGNGGASTAPTGGGGATTGTAGVGGSSSSSSSSSNAIPPDGFCKNQEDCAEEGGSCYAPGTVPMCGACMPPDNPCNTDADCTILGPNVICGMTDCLCSSGCIQGCIKNGDCAFPEVCGADHHCGPMSCNKECPFGVDLTCTGGICVRMSCSVDADCDHICVLGQCYDSFGVCAFPPP